MGQKIPLCKEKVLEVHFAYTCNSNGKYSEISIVINLVLMLGKKLNHNKNETVKE